MNKLHLSVSAANLVALLALPIGAILHSSIGLAVAVVGGYIANLAAILVAVVLLLVMAVRLPLGMAGATARRQWLGLVNGAIVVGAWALYPVIGKLLGW